MNASQAQLTLSVVVREDARFANFYVGTNDEVVDAIQRQWTLTGENYLYLWGQGSGCSHLLQAACHYAEGLGHHSVYLPLDELADYSPAVLDSLESLPLIAVDNLQAIAGQPEWEEALFHLFNRIRQNEGHLLVAANDAPNALPLQLEDLRSRLGWGVVYHLEPLVPEERALALVLKAKYRGILISENVARYIVKHGPQDMAGLSNVLERLDEASLTKKRNITKQFARSEMGWVTPSRSVE
jgi:DnaA family protein